LKQKKIMQNSNLPHTKQMFDFLFGKKRKTKRKVTRRQVTRRRKPRRYNVPGSPCNKLKRAMCKSKNECSYVTRRGCRRKGVRKTKESGFFSSPEPEGVITDEMKADAHIAATQVANDAALASANSGADANQIISSAREAGAETVKKYLEERRVPSGDISSFVKEWTEDFNTTASAFGRALRRQRNAGFGRTRFGFGFGECSDHKDVSACMNHTASGKYPCSWLNKSLNRCQKRKNGPVSHAKASSEGMYAHYITGGGGDRGESGGAIAAATVMSSLNDIDESEEQSEPVSGSAARGIYTCVGRDQKTCGGNPNCKWQPKANNGAGRCIRQIGHGGGDQYEGPIGEGAEFGRRYRFGNTCGAMKQPMMGVPSFGRRRMYSFGNTCGSGPMKQQMMGVPSFGKKKRSSRRKGTRKGKSARKPPASLLRRCKKYHIKTTKKSGKRRVYRKISLLKKLLNKKLKKLKKAKKSRKMKRRN
jgi:hypothetical protein